MYAKYKKISIKNLKLDMELVKGLAIFYGLSNPRWRTIDPKTLRFHHCVVTAIYDRLRYLRDSFDELQSEIESVELPNEKEWYPEMLTRLQENSGT